MRVDNSDECIYKQVTEEFINYLNKSGKNGLKILALNDNEVDVDDNLKTYKNIGGVWAILGKGLDKEEDWKWLQVAKTENIESEIREDIEYLKTELTEIVKLIRKNYTNQFGKQMFEYIDYKCTLSKEYLYHEIAKKYKYLIFICVGKSDDKDTRKDMEMYFAWKTRAEYWRNGGPYQQNNNYSDEKLKEIQKARLKDIDDSIKDNIDSLFEVLCK